VVQSLSLPTVAQQTDMRTFDYIFSYVTARTIYDYIQSLLNSFNITTNHFFIIVLAILALYILIGRR